MSSGASPLLAMYEKPDDAEDPLLDELKASALAMSALVRPFSASAKPSSGMDPKGKTGISTGGANLTSGGVSLRASRWASRG